MSKRMSYRMLALLSLVLLMSSVAARADECDTPAAESCAAMSQSASAPAKKQSAKNAKSVAGPSAKKFVAQSHR